MSDSLQRQITALLHRRHLIQNGIEDDFSTRNLTDVAETVNAATPALAILPGTIAASSLPVSGIETINTMRSRGAAFGVFPGRKARLLGLVEALIRIDGKRVL